MTIRVLVPISGGKDSQASLKLALENYAPSEVRGLFCDTRFEHPKTYAHVEWMRQYYGVQIDTVCAGSVEEQCLKHKRFPGGGARFCTEELKIWPTKRYCRDLAVKQGSILKPNTSDDHRNRQADGGFEVWYGMRGDESHERSVRYAGKVCDELYAPHEVLPGKYPKYLQRMGVMFRLCIVDWSTEDVVEFVGKENLNPLYGDGFPRVGCFPCMASGDRWKDMAFRHDVFGASQHQKVIRISEQIGKDIWTSKNGKARYEDQGCLFCSI